MRISQLSDRSAVPVPTIKFYLREGLLPPGQRTGTTQAEYDDTHLQRLRLIRALATHAGLSIAGVRELLAAIDDPPGDAHELFGVAHRAVSPPAHARSEERAAMRRMLEGEGWDLDTVDDSAIDAVAVAYRHLHETGVHFSDDLTRAYIDAAAQVARAEVVHVPFGSTPDAIAYIAVGSVLAEPLLLALRRLAEQVESSRRFGGAGIAGPGAAGLPAEG